MTAILIVLLTLIFSVITIRYTVSKFYEENEIILINDKLFDELSDGSDKKIEYIAAVDEAGNSIILRDFREERAQPRKNVEKKGTGFFESNVEKLNELNQQLLALSLTCTPDPAYNEPSPCYASQRKSKLIGGVWTPVHCHCTFPEGSR